MRVVPAVGNPAYGTGPTLHKARGLLKTQTVVRIKRPANGLASYLFHLNAVSEIGNGDKEEAIRDHMEQTCSCQKQSSKPQIRQWGGKDNKTERKLPLCHIHVSFFCDYLACRRQENCYIYNQFVSPLGP